MSLSPRSLQLLTCLAATDGICQPTDRRAKHGEPKGRPERYSLLALPQTAGRGTPDTRQESALVPQSSVTIRARLSTDCSSIATGTTGHVTPERISSEAADQSQ